MSCYLIVTGDFVTTGGMDRANYALASYLARRGDEVHLVAHRVADDLLAFSNVTFHRVPKPAGSYVLGCPILDRVGRFWAARVSGRGGRVIVNGGNCNWGDVNWVHYVHAAYSPAVRHGFLRQAVSKWNHHRWLRQEKVALRSARLVIANSGRTSRDLANLVGVEAARVETVYYGSDQTEFRPDSEGRSVLRASFGWPPDRPVIAFIGAMTDRRKGFDTLLDAFKLLMRVPRWAASLVVVGAGAEVRRWEAHCERVGIADRVQFLGFRRDVSRILQACDLLVAPTRYEAYGLAVHEALCCGVPALVTETAGVAERFPAGLRRLLVPDGVTPEGLAGRLVEWHSKVEFYRGEAIRVGGVLRSQTWDDMSRQILSHVEHSVSVGAGRMAPQWSAA